MPVLSASSIQNEVRALLESFGIPEASFASGNLCVRTPITGEIIARLPLTSAAQATSAIAAGHRASLDWRSVPAPRRGELVRLLGEELRQNLPSLGRLVTLEAGKILSEGCGEVQEMIDICGFAAGLS